MNLFAALAGAGAAGLIGATICRVCGSRMGAFLAVTALATGFTWWRESTSAEVYTLSAFFLALLLYLLPERRDPRRVLLSAWVWGLALTNHLSLAFLVPPFLIHTIRRGKPGRNTLLLAALLFLVALTPYLYLPVRASLSPPWNWGDPSTLERLLNHISGRGYWGYMGEGSGIGRAADWLTRLGREMTYLVWAAVPLGLWVMRKVRRDLLLLVAGGGLLSLGYTFHFQIHDPDAYFLPVYLLMTLPFGVAVAALRGRWRIPVFVLAAALLLLQAVRNAPVENRLSPGILPEYVSNLLRTVEKGGVLIVEGDNETFGALYATVVEGEREEITLWNPMLDGMPEGPLFRGTPPKARAPGWKKRAIEHAIQRGTPVYTVVENDEIGPVGWRLIPWGILFRYVDGSWKPGDVPPRIWDEYGTRCASSVTNRSGYLARILAATYPLQRSRHHFLREEREEGERRLEEAIRIGDGIGPVWNNAGLAYRRIGDLDSAERLFRSAVEVSRDGLPLLNLSRITARTGRRTEAEEMLRSVIAIDPRFRYTAYLELGELLLEEGRLEESKEMFRSAAAGNAGKVSPLIGMARTHIERGEMETAWVYFRRAENLRRGMALLGELLIADYRQREGRLGDAARIYRMLAESDPEGTEPLRLLALLEADRGRYVLSDSLFEAACSVGWSDPENRNAFAWSLAEHERDPERALMLIREAREIDPDNASYIDTEGYVLYRLGRYVEAAELYGKAIFLGHDDADTRYRLGFSLIRTGRAGEGAASLRTAISMDPESPCAPEARDLLR